ncbi:Retrovirus-related pol polyprotein from transposon tnt 1-94 [Thalictrum thalictroides]|uniref:Retrovirus-related pol polyprotein from transposon tnt 1-94 n=1 Tax=Thalictrum thalictroides TaxID=46969 RepID=A0A7J6WQV8_THATH|nr:Retrovirus-related pol polyprotein from transposon tnt 1-94 [Thalictrum thalictroides]
MFVYKFGSQIMIILVYVDDIVLTGNVPSLLSTFIATLSRAFEIRDFGPLHYFLGIDVSSLRSGLHLSQTKYTLELLICSNMLDCKPCSTPLRAKSQLSVSDGTLLPDASEYRHLVGSLQYLTLTRPDIAYVVHIVSQFMSAPRTDHYTAVKRILRYLKGSLDFGLVFRPSAGALSLHAFSDADWASCPDSRRSTTGFCVFLGS